MNITKHKIFGRRIGTCEPYALLIESTGVSAAGRGANSRWIEENSAYSLLRTTKMLRERGLEGYVLFEGDHTHYEFTQEEDFLELLGDILGDLAIEGRDYTDEELGIKPGPHAG